MIKNLLTLCLLVFAFSSFGQCEINITGTTTICSSSYSELNASYSGGGTLHWDVAYGGYGTFSSTVGNSVAYFPTTADSDVVTLRITVSDSGETCHGTVEYQSINIIPAHVSAGGNKTVCARDESVPLSASFTAGTIVWQTIGGTGTFSSTTSSNTLYIPSVSDITNGSVLIAINLTNSACVGSDSVLITFVNTAPTVSAGPDAALCANNPITTFFGTTSGATSRQWTSSGSGTFTTPSEDSTRYNPSPSDIANGSVVLTLTAYGCGGEVEDNMNILYTPAPTINVGTDQYLASQNYLSATYTGATGLMWYTSGAGTFSNTTSASTVYTPAVSEEWTIITAVTTGNGNCLNVNDQLYLFKDSLHCSLNAGPDQARCISDSVFLSVSTDIDSLLWSTSGNGTLYNELSASPTYAPALSDSNSTIDFIVRGWKASCFVMDTVRVTFTFTAASANAGADITACKNAEAVTVGIHATGQNFWRTSGTGYFSNPYSDTSEYYPSFADKENGVVMLWLTASGCGGIEMDTMVLSFVPGPVVDAGPNQQLTSSVSLSATTTNAAGVIWSSSGTGTFSNVTAIAPTYIPSALDLDSGYVIITATTTGNGMCNASSDYLILTGNEQVCNVAITKTVSANTVDFEATNTDGQSVGSYLWNFGDSTYAYGKVQSHVYATAGNFLVTLYYTTPDGLCTSVSEEVIVITNVATNTYSIGGTVYAGSSKLDHAFVTLFKLEDNVYKYMQSVVLTPSDNGYYTFTNVPSGQYIVYAIPSSLSAYLNYIACYFPNVTLWLGASPINVTNASQPGKNIYLMPFTPPSDGWDNGTSGISGTITFDINTNLRVTAPSANPSQYAVVSLYNEEGELLTTTNTDEFGNYAFSGIAAGNYALKVEYPGGNAGSESFSVTTTSGSVSEVNTQITRQEITVGLKAERISATVVLYPNPVRNELFISTSSQEDATVYLYNSLGSLMNQQDMNGTSNIEMAALPCGIYTYLIIQGEQKFAGKIIKE